MINENNDNKYPQDINPISEKFDLSNLTKCNHRWYRKSYTQIRCENCTMELIDVGNIDIVDGVMVLKT